MMEENLGTRDAAASSSGPGEVDWADNVVILSQTITHNRLRKFNRLISKHYR